MGSIIIFVIGTLSFFKASVVNISYEKFLVLENAIRGNAGYT